jgi:hypothetical protein
MIPESKYSTQVVNGRRYWYHNGEKVAAAKVPESIRKKHKSPAKKKTSVKKVSSKKPVARKPAVKKTAPAKPAHKSPSAKKSSAKKSPSKKSVTGKMTVSRLQDNCKDMTKEQILKAIGEVVDKRILCEIVNYLPRPRGEVTSAMVKKRNMYMGDTDVTGLKCRDKPIPRCPGYYCSDSTGNYECPDSDVAMYM